MSEIIRETRDYIEMSDTITLSIVKDGTDGTSINMKGELASTQDLPSQGAKLGDSYIIDGHLWTYTGTGEVNGFRDCGQVSGKSSYVHVAWSNMGSPSASDIVLSNTGGAAYAYMGTWVSETREDTVEEAVSMAKWVYVKGGGGDPGYSYAISVVKKDLRVVLPSGEGVMDVDGFRLTWDVDMTLYRMSGDGGMDAYMPDSWVAYWVKADGSTEQVSLTINGSRIYGEGSLGYAIDATDRIVRMRVDAYEGSHIIAQQYIDVAVDSGSWIEKTNEGLTMGVNNQESIAQIRMEAEEISAEVAAVKTTAEGNSSAISTLRQTANSLTSRVTTIEGAGYMTESEVEQTAERISMRVQNQSVGRRNLLKGSQLYKREHVIGTLTSELIATNKGYNMLATQSSTSENYSGLFWRWDKGGNIKIEKGKTYFASVEIMTHGTPGQNYQGYIESYYHANAVESARHGSPSMARNRWYIDTPGEWTLFTAKMKIPDDAEYEYIECNFICVALNDTTNPVFYLRKPMLEEADSYAGWTLSEEDYDYTGGNLLDGTRELVVTGNLTENSGTYTDGVDGCAATILTAGPEVLTWDLSGKNLSGDELALSFLAKGSANSSSTSELKISAYLGGSATVTVEGTGKENDFTTSSGGNISLTISPTWQRYWVHWHVKSGSPTSVSISAADSDSDPVVCQPKLEIGAHATGWIEGGDDLVDKRTLLATGIDIEHKKITLTADKTQLLDNSGNVIAVFSADGTLINSDLVDVAGAIRAKTIDCGEATFTNVTVSGVLKGVTGTFKRLDAVDGSGTVKGSLVFNSDGELGVNSDFYIGSRGFGQSIGRNMTIPDNIICQGLFGTSQLAMAVVIAGTMRIYNKGIQQATDITSNYMAVNLMSYTYGGARYYDIPLLYHIEGYKISRYFPINLVVFKGNATYNYSLASEIGKHVILVNTNNGVAQNIAHVGGWFGMAGGACAHAILLHDSLMYQTSSFSPGKNTFIAGYHDNNWT